MHLILEKRIMNTKIHKTKQNIQLLQLSYYWPLNDYT